MLINQIREYAIHRLSTDVSLSPIEKIVLARAHKVVAWLDEGVNSLASGDHSPTLEDLAALGWETAARNLWIRDNSSPYVNGSNTLRFRKCEIKCAHCSSSSSLLDGSYNRYHYEDALLEDEELTFPDPGSASGTANRLVLLSIIQRRKCGGNPFQSISLYCNSCSQYTSVNQNVRITLKDRSKEMIKQIIGEEIMDYELAIRNHRLVS